MIRNNFKLIFLFLYLFISACKTDVHGPLKDDGVAPDPVTVKTVKNLSGGAVITYGLPKNSNLAYVIAEYEIRPGKLWEVRSSGYNDSLKIEGLGGVKDYEIKLYAVNKGEKRSTPVSVRVSPLSSPVLETFRSLKVVEDFGGVRVNFENKAESNVVVSVLRKNKDGEWVTAEVNYTKNKTGMFNARGLESKLTTFGVFVKDRWDNRSDTSIYELTPIYETLIPKPFAAFFLVGDQKGGHGDPILTIDKIWNGVTGNSTEFHTSPKVVWPQWFSFDLKVTSQLSRFKMYFRTAPTMLYNAAVPKKWEVWGAAEKPTVDMATWTKLMDCESYKPSGFPVGLNSNDDKVYAEGGEDFTFPPGTPAVRYLRFKITETWGGVDYFYISEVTFWGGNFK